MAQGFTRGTPIDTDPNLSLDSDLVVPSQKAIKDYVDTGLSNKVNRSGDTMSGNLILNVNPTLPLQAATKDYVDTLINGIDWKQAADAGTVATLPAYTVTGSGQILTGNVNGAIPSVTTDGVTLTANQRLLVKNETSTLTPNNGIYVVTQVGSGSLPFILTRSSDANTPALLAEATLSVKSGTTLANTQWHCNPSAVPIVIGTTNITFAQIGGGTYAFSPPLAVAGNIVSIPPATSSVDGYLTSSNWSTFNGKQDALVSGTNIKTVNSNSLLGSGNVSVGTVTSVSATVPSPASPALSVAVTNPTTTPAIAITANGTTAQYFRGDGSLATFPTSIPVIYKSTTDGTGITGVASEQISSSQLIPANTFTVGDIVRVTWRVTKTGTASSITCKLYANTAASLSGAIQLGQIVPGFTNSNSNGFQRHLAIKASNNTQTIGNASTFTDYNTLTAVTTANINWTVDQYIIFMCQLSSATADVVRTSFYLIEKI